MSDLILDKKKEKEELRDKIIVLLDRIYKSPLCTVLTSAKVWLVDAAELVKKLAEM